MSGQRKHLLDKQFRVEFGSNRPLLAASLVLAAPASARDVINGTGGNDFLQGTPRSDIIRGFGGHDQIQSRPGRDLIHMICISA